MIGVGLMGREGQSELRVAKRMLLALILISFIASLLLLYVAFG